MRPERIPYGVKDFKRIRLEDRYYVDKSQFIERLENRADFLFFVRPRRFGKSLLCEMLRCYYDVAEKENFKSLYYCYGIVTMGRFHRGNLLFRVPNECVRRQIFDYMREEYAKRPNAVNVSEFIERFDAFAWDGDWKGFLTWLAEKYRENGSPRDGIDGEARINGYLRAYLTLKNAYMVKPEMAHPLGFSDYALFPDPTLPFGGVPEQSYVIELKHAPKDASDAVLEKNHAEALEQLKRYAADPNLPALANGTPVHFLCYEFRGRDLIRLEEIDAGDL